MADPITPAVSQRICKHMNDDHADAVLVYVQKYGNVTEATAAVMDAIDPEGMDLTAQVNGTDTPVRVQFERTLADSEDAHHMLIDMLKQSRSA